ncbi:MAG TPA: Rpn family recombination-promoting nuclease/putative transposase [Fibrobacteraceae bacterium]|nr:Rpn family recombination-promoting nuclease/putative transposase [Fibrobacteraceae bacterium]
MTPTYIDPFSDLGFKAIFLSPKNKPILIGFLNAVLERIGESRIVDLDYLPMEHVGLDTEHKKVVQDLECRAEDGRHFIVEMQRAIESDFRDRMAFYAFRASIEDVKAGERYHLRPVYVLVIMEEALRPETPDFLQMATLRFEKSDERLVRYPIFLFLETCKVPELRNISHPALEWWSYCLAHMGNWSQPPKELDLKSPVSQLLEAAKFANFTVDEQKAYLQGQDQRRDMKYALEYKWQKGFEEGISQGISQGIAEGLEQDKIDMVAGMLANNLGWDLIEKITHLDQAGYEALRKRRTRSAERGV